MFSLSGSSEPWQLWKRGVTDDDDRAKNVKTGVEEEEEEFAGGGDDDNNNNNNNTYDEEVLYAVFCVCVLCRRSVYYQCHQLNEYNVYKSVRTSWAAGQRSWW